MDTVPSFTYFFISKFWDITKKKSHLDSHNFDIKRNNLRIKEKTFRDLHPAFVEFTVNCDGIDGV